MAKKIFIFGTGRCGTKTLSKIFEKVPESICAHEGIFYIENKIKRLSDLKEFNEKIYYKKQNLDYYSKTFFNKKNNIYYDLDRLFRSRNLIYKNYKNNSLILESNPYFYNFINYIYFNYPDSIFIHLIRDGQDVVSSYYNRTTKPKAGICIDRTFSSYPTNLPESKYYGYQSGKPRPLSGDKYFEDWKNFNRVQKLSWFWNYVNLNIYKRMKIIPDNQKYILKLEDINNFNFKELFDKLKINYKKEYVNISTLNKGEPAKIWNKKSTKRYLEITKEARSIFEYK